MPEQDEVQAITKSGRALPLEVNPRVICYKGPQPWC